MAILAMSVALVGSVGMSQAAVTTTEGASYLFVVDSSNIAVTPLAGDAARVVVTGPAVTRFTDRPEREAERIGVRGMLREFGWTRASKRLMAATPNASISIAGEPSQIVDIKRARVSDGRVILRVKGITGPLESMRGAGSLFVDNAPTYPMTQNVAIMASDSDPGSPPLTTATVVVRSSTEAAVTLDLTAIDPGFPERTFTIEIGNPLEQEWTANGLSLTVEITSNSQADSTLVNVALVVVGVEGTSVFGEGQAFFAW